MSTLDVVNQVGGEAGAGAADHRAEIGDIELTGHDPVAAALDVGAGDGGRAVGDGAEGAGGVVALGLADGGGAGAADDGAEVGDAAAGVDGGALAVVDQRGGVVGRAVGDVAVAGDDFAVDGAEVGDGAGAAEGDGGVDDADDQAGLAVDDAGIAGLHGAQAIGSGVDPAIVVDRAAGAGEADAELYGDAAGDHAAGGVGEQAAAGDGDPGGEAEAGIAGREADGA